MRVRFVPVALVMLAASACGSSRASADNPQPQTASEGVAVGPAAADPTPALAALDAISRSDWLRRSSKDLLARVIAASSKGSLDGAAKTDARAQALAATGHFFGIDGYAKDNAEAARLYRLAAVSNPIAQVNLGAMLNDGTAAADGKPAPEAAADFFRKAGEQGHPVGALNLALLYRDGTGVAQDYGEAAKWFRLAADAGVAKAQYELAEIYRGGFVSGHLRRRAYVGVPMDVTEADHLNQAAADQGFADALYRAAENAITTNIKALTEAGEETALIYDKAAAAAAPGFKKALDAYERDAQAGDLYARARVGDLHYLGQGVSKDAAVAYSNYKAAADRGWPGAQLSMARLLVRGEGVARNLEAAAAIYRPLAAQGYSEAEYLLGRMTEAGTGGIAPNREEAMRLIKLAARHGEWNAQRYLKKLGESW